MTHQHKIPDGLVLVGYQWLDTAIFRRRVPKSSQPETWRPVYALKDKQP